MTNTKKIHHNERIMSYWEKALDTMGVTGLSEPRIDHGSSSIAYIDLANCFQVYYSPANIKKENHLYGIFLHEIGHYLFFPFDPIVHFRSIFLLSDKYGDVLSQENIYLINNLCQDLFIDYVIYKRKDPKYNDFIEDLHKKQKEYSGHIYANSLFDVYRDLKFAIHGICPDELYDRRNEIKKIFDQYLYNSRDFIDSLLEIAEIFIKEVKELALEEYAENKRYDDHDCDHDYDHDYDDVHHDREKEYDENEILNDFLSENNEKDEMFYPSQKFELDQNNYHEFLKYIPNTCSFQDFEKIFGSFLPSSSTEQKKQFYKLKAANFRIKNDYYSQDGTPIKLGIKRWEIGDRYKDLDMVKTKTSSPYIWLNAKKSEKYIDKKNISLSNPNYPDLLIVLDTSNSMGSKQMDLALTCVFGLIKIARKKKRSVSSINFSSVAIVEEWTKDQNKIMENVLNNQRNGTILPIDEIIDMIKSPKRKEKDPILIIIISDGLVSDIEELKGVQKLLKKTDKLIVFQIDSGVKTFQQIEQILIHNILELNDLKNLVIDYAKKSYEVT